MCRAFAEPGLVINRTLAEQTFLRQVDSAAAATGGLKRLPQSLKLWDGVQETCYTDRGLLAAPDQSGDYRLNIQLRQTQTKVGCVNRGREVYR